MNMIKKRIIRMRRFRPEKRSSSSPMTLLIKIITIVFAAMHLLFDFATVGAYHHNDVSSWLMLIPMAMPSVDAAAFVLPSPQRSLRQLSMSSSFSSGNTHFRRVESRSRKMSPPPSIPPPTTRRTNNNNNDNRSTRLLTQEEEQLLLLQVHDPNTRHTVMSSKEARQELLLYNLPLVRSIVTNTQRSRGRLPPPQRRNQGGGVVSRMSSHFHHGVTASSSSSSTTGGGGGTVGTALTTDDLLHEGTIGLAEAIDRHNILLHLNNNNNTAQYSNTNNTTTTTRLSTYATYWIRARILRALHNRGEHAILRFPEHVIQASHRLVKSAKVLGLEWEDVVDMVLVDTDDGEEDTKLGNQTRILRDRLCSMANIPLKKSKSNLFHDAVRVRCMSMVGQYTTSLESWMTDDAASSSLEDVVDDNDEDNTSSIADIESYDDDETLGDDETQVIVGGGGGQNIVNTLSKFLIPREIEVLSLRYGLIPPTSLNAEEEEMGGSSIQVIEKKKYAIVDVRYCNDKQQQQHQQSQQPPLAFHDYETEAMDGLFGPQGMLSHYNTVASSPTFTNNEGGVSSTIVTTTVAPAIAVAVPTTITKTMTLASSSMEMQSLSKTTTLSVVSQQLCNGGELSPGMIIPTTPSSSSSPISSRSSSSSKSSIINNNNNNNGKQQTLLSFKEIGKHMKFSSEYCRRTCSVALNKLTRAVEEGRLVESDFILGW